MCGASGVNSSSHVSAHNTASVVLIANTPNGTDFPCGPSLLSTALTRFLGDYLKKLEGAATLVAARGDVFADFARAIRAELNDESSDDENAAGGGRELDDRKLVRIFGNGNLYLLNMLSQKDRERLWDMGYNVLAPQSDKRFGARETCEAY